MMNNKNRFLKWPIAMIAVLSLTFTACKKNSMYYDYENNVKEYNGTVLQYLEAQDNTFDSLLVVLDLLPDLKDSLTNEQVTFFAPTNASFVAAIKTLNIERTKKGKSLMSLKDCPLDQLDTLATRYILRGVKTTDVYKPFVDGTLYPTLKSGYNMHLVYDKLNASGFVDGGPSSVIFSDPKNNIFVKYWERSTTNAVNLKAKNGIVNILSPLHDFGFNEFVQRVNQ